MVEKESKSPVHSNANEEPAAQQPASSNQKPKGLLPGILDSRLFGGALPAAAMIVGGAIGYSTDLFVQNREMAARSLELLSSRETATQTLQADIFGAYLQHVVPTLDDGNNDYKKVAALAGLHSNFSEFFDTRPVFAAFSRQIESPVARYELTRLSKRVARHQAEYVKAHAGSTGASDSGVLTWPAEEHGQLMEVAGHRLHMRVGSAPFRHYEDKQLSQLRQDTPALFDVDDHLIDDVADYVPIEVWQSSHGSEKTPAHATAEADMELLASFNLSYMDTPYMDTVWLAHEGKHDQLSLRLTDIDTDDAHESHTIAVELIHFPADLFSPTQMLPVQEMLAGGHAIQ